MDVAVLIVSYRSLDDLLVCLSALGESTHPNFRVVICENGGPAAFEKVRAALPKTLSKGQSVSIWEAPGNLGYAGGVNFALDHAGDADAYWILNPDTQPAPDALASMIERLKAGDCGMVGHDLVLTDGRLASRGGGQWRPLTARAISIDKGAQRTSAVDPTHAEGRIGYLVGASILVSADALKIAGRMRDDYFLYCEEVEWCLRAVRRGVKLGYAPGAVVVHAHGTSTGGGGQLRDRSKLSVYLIARNRVLVTRDMFPERLALTRWLILGHLVAKFLKARAARQLLYALSGWKAGLRNERGAPGWLSST
jgi:GT2 family glycosyltransferase